MQTHISEILKDTSEGQEADTILRTCVHCGFCNATCPTYQLLGDELDGPRGRIYLMKQMFEGQPVGRHTQTHLDRCLTCRNCETTCPSGVEYGRLLDLSRPMVEARVQRPVSERAMRWLLRQVLPYRARFAFLLALGRTVRPALPQALRSKVPRTQERLPWPQPRHPRRMLVLEGCVQPSIAPRTNAAAARVLDRLGISLRPAGGGCCGAMSYHLSYIEEAREAARRNIDAWYPALEAGAEALVMTASGCGAHIKEYGHILRDDPDYAQRAAEVAARTRDLSEVISKEDLGALPRPQQRRIAFQSPCTLQHGQQLAGRTEGVLRDMGLELVPVADKHLCCGSAGTYSILQPELAQRLRDDKLAKLQANEPEVVATANIGCQVHLQSNAGVPVRHWIELLAEPIAER